MIRSTSTSGLIAAGSPPRSSIASRIAARSTTAGHAGEVLHQHPGRLEGDLDRGLRLRVPGRDRLDVLGGDRLAVLEAQRVLEQDLERVGQAGDVELLLQRVEAVDLVLAARHLEGAAGAEAVAAAHRPSLRAARLTLVALALQRACRPAGRRRRGAGSAAAKLGMPVADLGHEALPPWRDRDLVPVAADRADDCLADLLRGRACRGPAEARSPRRRTSPPRGRSPGRRSRRPTPCGCRSSRRPKAKPRRPNFVAL